ncbi:MAG: hypothetical protein K0S45_3727 [Nitrospira sp.]|nr:hypothetical protein [Nitrospira sp.]
MGYVSCTWRKFKIRLESMALKPHTEQGKYDNRNHGQSDDQPRGRMMCCILEHAVG